MTNEAIWFMTAVWSVVIGNVLYCFWRLTSAPREETPDDFDRA